MRPSRALVRLPALLAGLALGSGCAPGKLTERPDSFLAIRAGERSTVEVYNPTPCPADVFVRHNAEQRRTLGTVPAYGREVFQVSDSKGGALVARALQENGQMCGRTLHNRVQMRILDPAAAH